MPVGVRTDCRFRALRQLAARAMAPCHLAERTNRCDQDLTSFVRSHENLKITSPKCVGLPQPRRVAFLSADWSTARLRLVGRTTPCHPDAPRILSVPHHGDYR